MSEDGTAYGARINAIDAHNCFGCGRLNSHGLRLTIFRLDDGEGVWAPFIPQSDHEGYAGLTHGGIISTVLDEVMAWSLYAREVWAVTARISVAFRKPVEVGESTRAVGSLVADRGRLLDVAGQLLRERDGVVLAEATATFARVPEAQALAWRERYLGSEG